MAEAAKKSHYRWKARRGRRVTVHYRVLAHGELRRHRGIDVLVGAAHLVAGSLEEAGQRAHAGATDGDQVELHERILVLWQCLY